MELGMTTDACCFRWLKLGPSCVVHHLCKHAMDCKENCIAKPTTDNSAVIYWQCGSYQLPFTNWWHSNQPLDEWWLFEVTFNTIIWSKAPQHNQRATNRLHQSTAREMNNETRFGEAQEVFRPFELHAHRDQRPSLRPSCCMSRDWHEIGCFTDLVDDSQHISCSWVSEVWHSTQCTIEHSSREHISSHEECTCI